MAETRTRPFLILLRAGDNSLHPTWMEPLATRNWDMHLSYFGSKGAPAGAKDGAFTWTADGGATKWTGLDACLAKKPFDIDAYEYVAFPDDDLAGKPGTWTRAFELALEYGILACQISLDHRSFYMHNITLQRRELRLRYVNQIEHQTPIMRVDVFKYMAERFSIPNNVYGIEFEICDYVSKYPNATAILDEVSMLQQLPDAPFQAAKELPRTAVLSRHGGATRPAAPVDLLPPARRTSRLPLEPGER